MNTYDETKFILKKYGISANKSLGQNFLINDEVVNKIVESAEITKEDLVIEIGPGLGTLTKELLEKAGKVVAIELDKRMIEILSDRFKLYNNFELINQDILKINLKELIENNNIFKKVKIVANLPYYITTPIIMKLLEEELKIETITVMIQKEVADRLTEVPGGKNSGAITYSIYYYAEAKEVLRVMPQSFIPEPAVESKVIQLNIRKEKNINVNDKDLMFKLIKYAFMQRRKTLVNAWEKTEFFNNKNEIKTTLNSFKISEKARGEELTMEQYAQIADYLCKN